MSRYQAPIAAGIAFAAFGIFGSLPVILGLALTLGLDASAVSGVVIAAGSLLGLGRAALRYLPFPLAMAVAE